MRNRPLYEVREIENLKQMLKESAELYKDNTAYLVKNDKKEYINIMYPQVLDDMNALGTALIDLGLKGKRIAVIGENRYEWAISYLAVINGVGVIVPLDKQLPQNEIISCMERAEVDCVIYSGKLQETIDVIAEMEDMASFYINMDLENEDGKYLSLKKLINKGKELVKSGNSEYIDTKIDIDDMAELLFTSGTTAKSKAVMLSQKNIVYNLHQMCQMVHIKDDDVFLSMLPMHHVYECVCGFLVPLYRGAAVAYCEGLRYIQKNLEEAHVSVFLSVPLVFETLYKKIWEAIDKQGKTKLVKTMIKITNILDKIGIHLKRKIFKDIHNQLGGRARLYIAGAAGINPEVSKGFRDFGILAIQGYGLTECAPIVAVNRNNAHKDASVGLPLVGTELMVVNVNEDGVGEIITKGDHVMLGYYENEEATKENLKDGWFYTGDLGYQDDDGFVYITGRKKNVLITKNGKNVYPEEIEALLNDSDYIEESMVYLKPVKDDLVLSAEIRVNKEYIEENFKDISKEELKKIIWEEVKRIQQDLVIYKHIKEIHIRETEFEKTTTLKIKRYLEKTVQK
ncbi:MAG: AMP-binding protein [Clostridia bacterium]|nr:AMP-binding protein [Clostridia bacterium]